jgi:hypothetical protein
VSAPTHRRQFLQTSVGVAFGAGALLQACTAEQGQSPPVQAPSCGVDAGDDAAPPVVDASAAEAGPAFAVAEAGLPLRQDDPKWSKVLMWNRDLVIQAAHELNGETLTTAQALLREFDDGNTIGNEGCMLTCLAMVLRLMQPEAKPAWTPKRLNQLAHEAYYYTLSGLSMTTLYADLVAEVSGGAVQLCLKEEYLPGEPGWAKLRASTSPLVRACRSLPASARQQFLVMLKTGTYDDTVASHYLLLDPNEAEPLEQDDVATLDPAMPATEGPAVASQQPWRLSHSAATITQDPEIKQGWQDAGIEPTQLGGVWVFARMVPGQGRPQLAALVAAWARELAKAG